MRILVVQRLGEVRVGGRRVAGQGGVRRLQAQPRAPLRRRARVRNRFSHRQTDRQIDR